MWGLGFRVYSGHAKGPSDREMARAGPPELSLSLSRSLSLDRLYRVYTVYTYGQSMRVVCIAAIACFSVAKMSIPYIPMDKVCVWCAPRPLPAFPLRRCPLLRVDYRILPEALGRMRIADLVLSAEFFLDKVSCKTCSSTLPILNRSSLLLFLTPSGEPLLSSSVRLALSRCVE